MKIFQTWWFFYLGLEQPCLIKDNHQECQGGQQEGVQEGPLHVGGIDHKIVKIRWKSSKLEWNFCLGQGQPGPIKDNHQEGQGGQREVVQEGPFHVGGEDCKIIKIRWKSSNLGEIFAWVKDNQVPSRTSIREAKAQTFKVSFSHVLPFWPSCSHTP